MAEKVELPPGVSKEDAEKFLAALKDQPQPVIFKTIDTGYNTQVRIQKTIYKGKVLYGIQKFWRDDAGDWQYGKAITFSEDGISESIDDIIDGFTQMKAHLEEAE